jgi:DNA-binding response OmpR family regulator
MPELHILMVEDSDTDARLTVRALQKANIRFSSKRVETEAALRRELREHPPDLILSDHDLPGFNGISSLRIAREVVPSTPFIVVSDSQSEETRSAYLAAGADAYVAKDNLRVLGKIVLDALFKKALSAVRQGEIKIQE